MQEELPERIAARPTQPCLKGSPNSSSTGIRVSSKTPTINTIIGPHGNPRKPNERELPPTTPFAREFPFEVVVFSEVRSRIVSVDAFDRRAAHKEGLPIVAGDPGGRGN